MKQIATGKLDKVECLDKNLFWFEERYHELSNSLTPQRLKRFAHSLKPIKESLKQWRKLGAFEEMQPIQARNGAQSANSRRPKRNGKDTIGAAKRKVGSNWKKGPRTRRSSRVTTT